MCPVLLDLLQFDLFAEYVVTRRNFKTGKYLSIYYNKNLILSLMLFCCFSNFYVDGVTYVLARLL